MYSLKIKSVLVALLIGSMSFVPLSARKHTKSETAGDVLQITIPISALAIALSKDDTEGMKQLFYSVTASTAVTWGLKLAVNKKRPRGGKYSFPSGHTSLAFSGASFLGMRYGCAYGVPAVGLASYVGYSRVQAKRHDWADVIGGAVIGGLSSYVFTTTFDQNKTQKKTNSDK